MTACFQLQPRQQIAYMVLTVVILKKLIACLPMSPFINWLCILCRVFGGFGGNGKLLTCKKCTK